MLKPRLTKQQRNKLDESAKFFCDEIMDHADTLLIELICDSDIVDADDQGNVLNDAEVDYVYDRTYKLMARSISYPWYKQLLVKVNKLFKSV